MPNMAISILTCRHFKVMLPVQIYPGQNFETICIAVPDVSNVPDEIASNTRLGSMFSCMGV